MSRLAPSANINDLFQSVLPTPKIRSVNLKLSPLPPPVNNPHIDHKRETIIYEGRDGTRKFGAQSFAGGKDPRNLLVEVVVVLLDTVEDDGSSKWFKEEDLMKYLRLQVIHSEDKQFSAAIRNGDFTAIPSEVNKFKKLDGSVLNTIIPLTDKLEDFYDKQQYDREVREVVHKFNFAVATTTPEHLTYFANVYLDTEQLINDFSLDLPPGMLGQACSDTTVESVYRNKSMVRTASVYYYKGSNTMFTGNPYAVGNGTYITSDVVNDQMITLDLMKILNSFQQDSRSTRANSYRRKIQKIVDNNSRSKLLQLRDLVSGWKERSGGSKSATLYKTLTAKKKVYDSLVSSQQVLTRKSVSNPTIKDERTIQDLSTITVDVADIDESIEDLIDIRSGDERGTTQASAENLKSSLYFSDISIARDDNNNARMVFFVDWRKMIAKNTKYAGLLQNTNVAINDTLRTKVKIQGIRLIRERKDEENVISQVKHRNTRDRESVIQVIADAHVKDGVLQGTRQERSVFKKKSLTVGALKEISLTGISDHDLRAFEAVDYNISDKTAGKYKYSVQVSFTDAIGPYLASRANELSAAKEALKQYYNISVMKCNYDIKSERFTEFFMSALYEKYSFPNPDTLLRMSVDETNALLATSSPLQAPWMKPIAKYVEILNLFGNISDSDGQTLAKKMYLKVEPSTGSPDGILEVIKQFEELEAKIAEVLGLSLVEMGNNQSVASKIGNVLLEKKRVDYQFKTELDCSTLSSVKSRYLEYAQRTDTGLSYISDKDLRLRFAQEEEKYLNGAAGRGSTALNDMSTYRYSYLSPSYLQVGGKSLSLLNRGEALYDVKQYQEMVFSISLLKTNSAARSMTMPVLNMPTSDLQQSTAASARSAGMNFQALSLLSNFGITFAPPSLPASLLNVTDEPITGVKTILGENTLLAIDNAIKSSSDENGEDGTQITVTLNNEIVAADATSFATSLISSLVNVGIKNFSGASHGNMQVANFSPQVKQDIEFSKTLDFYNLTVPENGIDAKVRSSNSISSADSDSKIRAIPNQLKSIFLTKTGEVSPRKNWFTMETDPMADPSLRPLFEILYFNLQQIEVLTGFNKSKSDSSFLLRSPVYKLLNAQHLSSQGKLLCRLQKYRNDSLQIGQTETMDLPVANEYFILDLSTKAIKSKNPVIESDLTTDGSEYKLPDGTNYIGSYHIHKDGTVMTGANMGDDEQVLTRLASAVTTKARASALAAKNLSGTASTYEKTVLESLVSTHYDQVSVASEYCITADTIPSPGRTAGTSTGHARTKTTNITNSRGRY